MLEYHCWPGLDEFLALRFPSVCFVTTRPSHIVRSLYGKWKENVDNEKALETFAVEATKERIWVIGELSRLETVTTTITVGLVMSVNVGENHWHTIVVELRTKEIKALDSLPPTSEARANVVDWIRHLQHYINIMGWNIAKHKRWRFMGFADCTTQKNGIDCGRYALWNAYSSATVLQSGGKFPSDCEFRQADFVETNEGRIGLLDFVCEFARKQLS